MRWGGGRRKASVVCVAARCDVGAVCKQETSAPRLQAKCERRGRPAALCGPYIRQLTSVGPLRARASSGEKLSEGIFDRWRVADGGRLSQL